MKKTLLLAISLVAQLSIAQTAQEIEAHRRHLILQAVNSQPEKILAPLTDADVELGRFDGRVVVNRKAKFTYYVHIQEGENLQSKMTLIPMSTSRFTPTYYQTDEWWDAHKAEMEQAKKEGKPAPKQDFDEVAAWLEEMKLSTDPDVIQIDSDGKSRRQSLHDFLMDVYLQNFVENGKVILYRGAEKPNELADWRNGETPRGVRYWTPTANYAWRYARKNLQFLDLMMQEQTPLFRFEIPVEDFKAMINRKWRRLTLGTELTKNAHQIFDRSHYFGDHLYSNSPFLGVGFYGVEFELRSNRNGAQDMKKYFKRPATIEDLAQDRTRVLKLGMERLKRQIPSEFEASYKAQFESRLKAVEAELAVIQAMKAHAPEAVIQAKLSALPSGRGEIANIDGIQFSSWVKTNMKKYFGKSCGALH
ncbi:MAG: hypothetical protein ACAH59_13970 [Pseudobdellovibrionaceae bacterium]